MGVAAEIGGVGDGFADDKAAGDRGGGFMVIAIRADIADMGGGEGNNLSGVGGVGEDFLIAGHRRVEADFTRGTAGAADAVAGKHCPIGQ